MGGAGEQSWSNHEHHTHVEFSLGTTKILERAQTRMGKRIATQPPWSVAERLVASQPLQSVIFNALKGWLLRNNAFSLQLS
jgi:hypothetical protein